MFIPSKFAHISDDCHKSLERSQLKNGDVLFSIAGALGRVAVVDESVLPANTNQAISVISPTDEVNPQYLALTLQADLINKTIGGLKTGVAQSNLSLAQVSNFLIPIPPLTIQNEIVAEFNQELKIVETNKKLIKIYEQKIKDKITEVWEE